MRTYTYAGDKFRAHNVNCADGFKTDRRYGLIYSAYDVDNGDGTHQIMNVEPASIACAFCAYCGKE